MLYMVELNYRADQNAEALRFFDEHGITHYEQEIVVQGAWVATEDCIAYLLVESADDAEVASATAPLAQFGQVMFRTVVKAEQL